MTRKQLIKIAKEEINQWTGYPRAYALAILFCFIHRVVEGESYEETFCKKRSKQIDYQI